VNSPFSASKVWGESPCRCHHCYHNYITIPVIPSAPRIRASSPDAFSEVAEVKPQSGIGCRPQRRDRDAGTIVSGATPRPQHEPAPMRAVVGCSRFDKKHAPTGARQETLSGASRRDADGLPVRSFRTLLADLATLAKNRVGIGDESGSEYYELITHASAMQRRALELLGVTSRRLTNEVDCHVHLLTQDGFLSEVAVVRASPSRRRCARTLCWCGRAPRIIPGISAYGNAIDRSRPGSRSTSRWLFR
jgi:hypothetical protein